jgi:hypothetical protein
VKSILSLVVVVAAACSAPTSPPPPAPAAPAASPTSLAAISAPPPPATALPSPAPTVPPDATALAEPLIGLQSEPTATPPPASPTPVEAERLAPAEEVQALAGATDRGGPSPVALPPSARVIRGLTPTPDVVASSPVLAPGAMAVAGNVDYAGAIKRVQDARKAPSAPRLEDRIQAAVDRAQATGSTIEVLGWQAVLKGSTEVYQVSYTLRENRQGVQAVWEVNVATGEVRPMNALAETLDAS